MDITQIPLSERIDAVRAGRVGQPEYLPTLIRQWAKLPIKTYFGPCKKELERLYTILNLAPDENPAYQAVAEMIFDLGYPFGDTDAEALELLAAPVRENFAKRGKTNG